MQIEYTTMKTYFSISRTSVQVLKLSTPLKEGSTGDTKLREAEP